MRDESLASLPVAIPLTRVSPLWRILTVLLAIGIFFMLVVVFLLIRELVRVNLQGAAAIPATVATTAPPMVATTAPVTMPVTAEDKPVDPSVLPYPVSEDIPITRADEKPSSLARKRFLDAGQAVWNLPASPDLTDVVISWDGRNIAYGVGTVLYAGMPGSPQLIDANAPAGPYYGGPGMPGMAPGMPPPPPGMPWGAALPDDNPVRVIGAPTWVPNLQHVIFADTRGRLRRYDMNSQQMTTLPYQGDSPVLSPTDAQQLLFVRSRALGKLDTLVAGPAIDPTEVVQAPVTKGNIRVLIPESQSAWRSLAVSPDGKRLALVSNRGHEGKKRALWRVFVLDLQAGDGAEPRPITTPAEKVGHVCWATDGRSVIYARSQDPVPVDCLDGEQERRHLAMDLFQYDLDAMEEKRLSRGGGFFSPSMASDGFLHYLSSRDGPAGSRVDLRRIALSKAREWAAKEPPSLVRSAEDWQALAQDVLKEAGLEADLPGDKLNAQALTNLAGTFDRLHAKRFGTPAPRSIRTFDRQRRELARLELTPAARPGLNLVVAAAEGEHLRQKHAASWHLASGPLVPTKPQSLAEEDDSLFGMVVNPFALPPLGREDERSRSSLPATGVLADWLKRAQGRTLILSNDATAATAALAALVDPDLERGTVLLRQGKGNEADQVFEDLVLRHERNACLVVHVGKLLYDGNRRPTLLRIMEKQCARGQPPDPRKYNLWGLSLMTGDTRQAINAFKAALRTDLNYGPAYLNLAEAYKQSGQLDAARACLQRYLRLMPEGPLAADARRRLGAFGENGLNR